MSIQLRRRVLTPRRLLVLGAVLLLAVGLALALIPWQAEVTVRMAIPARTGSAPFYVALDKGFFRSEGVRVEMTVPTTGKAGIQMLAAGSTDLVTVGGVPVIDAILHGQPLWILAAVSHSDRHVGLVVPATIEDFKQLKGKRVAVMPGTITDLFIRMMLSGVGLTPADVEWVSLQPGEMPHALASGQVDVASNIEPFLTQTVAALPGSHILYANGNFLDYWLLVAAPEFVRSKPEVIPRVLAALVKAVHYIHQHPQESELLMSRQLLAPQNDWGFYDFRVQLDSFLVRNLTANAMMMQGDRDNLPDFQHYCYYRGLQSVLQSGVLPTPQERAE